MKAWTVIVDVGLHAHNLLSLLQNDLVAVKVKAASLQQNLFFLSPKLDPHQHPAILTFILVNFNRFHILAANLNSLRFKV